MTAEAQKKITVVLASATVAMMIFVLGSLIFTLRELRDSDYALKDRLLALEAWRSTIERAQREAASLPYLPLPRPPQ